MKLPSSAFAARHKNVTNEPRVITLNKDHAHEHYKGNYTSTTKYNVVTYFPKALFEQFRYDTMAPDDCYGAVHRLDFFCACSGAQPTHILHLWLAYHV